jgi:hypothetical protein
LRKQKGKATNILSYKSMITTNIKTFDFNKTGFSFFKTLPGGHNWPVVYLIEDGKELYV